MNEFDYIYLWLTYGKISTAKIHLLHKALSDIRELLKMKKEDIQRLGILNENEIFEILKERDYFKVEEKYEELRDKGIDFVHIKDERYPERLRNLSDYPYGIFVKGSLPKDYSACVAIVGARECSEYGKEVAYSFAKTLGNCGVSVISGMARGVDTFAHKGALSGIGDTYGVLGCGVDICYPRENIELYTNIIDRGGIISEYPPKTQPMPFQFPIRNRIISALSDAVLLVEAKEKSGSLITVDQALEQGKEVFVIPGRISDSLSKGCNNLIKMGAQPANEPKDILDYLSAICEINVKNKKKNNILLARNEKMVYSCLDLYPKNLNDIVNEIDLEFQEIMDIILNLSAKGLIKETMKNYYIKSME